MSKMQLNKANITRLAASNKTALDSGVEMLKPVVEAIGPNRVNELIDTNIVYIIDRADDDKITSEYVMSVAANIGLLFVQQMAYEDALQRMRGGASS